MLAIQYFAIYDKIDPAFFQTVIKKIVIMGGLLNSF